MSGGPRQRIVIASAPCEIRIYVQKATENLSQKDITLTIIAHRLSTIKNAGEIFPFKNGSVAEKWHL